MKLEDVELELQKLPEDTVILVFRVPDDCDLPQGQVEKLEALAHAKLQAFGRDMPVFVLCGLTLEAISKRDLEAQLT